MKKVYIAINKFKEIVIRTKIEYFVFGPLGFPCVPNLSAG